tara:strand:+ start:102 stop:281 length:180 start_codon:yes stop_codon:yes gene_type:complete
VSRAYNDIQTNVGLSWQEKWRTSANFIGFVDYASSAWPMIKTRVSRSSLNDPESLVDEL